MTVSSRFFSYSISILEAKSHCKLDEEENIKQWQSLIVEIQTVILLGTVERLIQNSELF